MKALRYLGPKEVKNEEIPIPNINDGEVLVQVKACGICATDVKTYQRGHPKIKPGAVLGHEISGIVKDIRGVDGWEVGERVVVAPYTPCLTCEQCQKGHFTLCKRLFDESLDPGGFTEYVRVPNRIVAQGLFRIPEALPFVDATLAEPIACCIHGLDAIEVHEGDSVLIIGDGPMGLLQIELAKQRGAGPVLLSGMTPKRLERAAMAADYVIDARQEDVMKVVQDYLPDGADKVIVSVGDVAALQSALSLVSKGGAINLFAGLPANAQITVDAHSIHYDEVFLTGSFGFTPKNFRQAVELLGTGKVDVSGIVTSTVDLDEVMLALEAAAEYQNIKTVALID
jgi:L-iditol 2-dehydrogenase